MNRSQIRIAVAVMAAALSLGACASAPKPETQAKIDATAAATCATVDILHGVFKTCAADNTFPKHEFCADKAQEEAAVYAGVHAACQPPYTLDPGVVVSKALKAITDIRALSGNGS